LSWFSVGERSGIHVRFGSVAAHTERGVALDIAGVNLERQVLVKRRLVEEE
jgi:hypothetical protein